MPKVLIIVEGGVVSDIISDTPGIKYLVKDFDNLAGCFSDEEVKEWHDNLPWCNTDKTDDIDDDARCDLDNYLPQKENNGPTEISDEPDVMKCWFDAIRNF